MGNYNPKPCLGLTQKTQMKKSERQRFSLYMKWDI